MRHAVIMAGGSGTRLWPMSRPDRPKQLIPFLPDGRSLLETAIDRIRPLIADEDRRWICTNESFRRLISERFDYRGDRLLAEPAGRDTLNAVGFSAMAIRERDPDATIAILTADHIIKPVETFVARMKNGFELVESHPETLATFSIVPDRPATEFGYIERGEAIAHTENAFEVKQYVEKPDLETAKRYLAAGKFGWSSGMFVFRAEAMLEAIRRFQPENFAGLERLRAAWNTPQQDAALREIYPTLPATSIDYAVMEPASRDPEIPVATVPMDLDWLDVGSWSSYGRLVAEDASGNRAAASTALIDCRDVLTVSDDPAHRIAVIGGEGLIVIHTRDATLICPKSREQEIKHLVERMK